VRLAAWFHAGQQVCGSFLRRHYGLITAGGLTGLALSIVAMQSGDQLPVWTIAGKIRRYWQVRVALLYLVSVVAGFLPARRGSIDRSYVWRCARNNVSFSATSTSKSCKSLSLRSPKRDEPPQWIGGHRHENSELLGRQSH